MSDLLILLDKDIKRCEDVLIENNYLEIVIAVEELVDKYKDLIDGITNNNSRTWNYTKKDLENIMNNLKEHKDKFIQDYNKNIVNSYCVDLKYQFNRLRKEFNEYKNIETDCINVLDDIEKISEQKISIDEKWIKLRVYMDYISTKEFNISSKFIYIINIILQNK